MTDNELVHVQHEYGLFGNNWYLMWVFYPILLILSRIHRRPVVITVHEAWNGETVDPPLAALKRLYVRLANELLAKTATTLVFLSPVCREIFEQSVDTTDYHQFAHGVGKATVEVPTSEAKREFGFSNDDTVITEPGFVHPSKGYETFLEIAERLPEYEFLVAGGSRDTDEYFDSIAAAAPDNVTITGHLSDERFHLAFRATDLVVLPYTDVAQSGIFNWCAAYGLPTAAKRLPYFEQLQSEYDCLLLFDSIDEAEEKITAVLNTQSTRERIIDGIQDYERENAFEKIHDQHVSLYRSIGSTGE